MRILRRTAAPLLLLLAISCSKGGPLTPAESFKMIRDAANRNDYGAVLLNLSSASHEKIRKFMALAGELNDMQRAGLAADSVVSADKLRNMKPADCLALYFAPGINGMNLRDIINEDIIAVDVEGSSAAVKTSGGFELDFVREGPYWKLDISRL